MKSVVRAGVRVVDCRVVFGLCVLFATACVEGDPIPQDVIQRAEGVLLEGNTGVAPAAVSPSGSASSGNSSSAAPGASATGFAANGNPPLLPEINELGAEELGEDAIPEDAIPLSDYLAH